jgi:3-oxoacyl-[acyl-carrier-protein] synthase II
MGIVTAHGLGKEVNWAKTVAGVSSIGPVTLFDTAKYRTRHAGEVKDLPLPPWERLRASRLDRASHLLYHAFTEALAESGLSAGALAEISPIVALGTTLGGMASGQRYHETYVRRGPDRANPILLSDHLAHCQGLHLMREFGIPGSPLVFSNACASGANAVGFAFMAVRAGETAAAVCGGYDPLCEFVFAGFHSLQALTPELCRPFDLNRNGLALGEGAGILLIEEWERARDRGARILGEIIGYGESADAFHMTRPDPEARGAEAALRRALESAGVEPETVDYINAHGTGTPFNDPAEAKAIRRVLGPAAERVPVSSIKPMIGHLLGGAGAVEAILTVLALGEKTIPPNLNYETADPECALPIVPIVAPADRMEVALSNSFGFGGANAALVLRAARHEGPWDG